MRKPLQSRFLDLVVVSGVIWATFGLASADATPLKFSVVVDTGEVASFVLDTAVPNTFDPALYPDFAISNVIQGVYLHTVYDLNFEGTHVALSDATTGTGELGDGRPITLLNVGPLFDNASLSLELVFLDPTLASPLRSNPLAYESSFAQWVSVLFPQTPPPRTHVNLLLSLTVKPVPEPEPASLLLFGAGVMGLFVQSRRRAMRQA